MQLHFNTELHENAGKFGHWQYIRANSQLNAAQCMKWPSHSQQINNASQPVLCEGTLCVSGFKSNVPDSSTVKACVGGHLYGAAGYILGSAGSGWPSSSAPSCWSPASGPATCSYCEGTRGHSHPPGRSSAPWSRCLIGVRWETPLSASPPPDSCCHCAAHLLVLWKLCEGNKNTAHFTFRLPRQPGFLTEQILHGFNGDSRNYQQWRQKRGEHCHMIDAAFCTELFRCRKGWVSVSCCGYNADIFSPPQGCRTLILTNIYSPLHRRRPVHKVWDGSRIKSPHFCCSARGWRALSALNKK